MSTRPRSEPRSEPRSRSRSKSPRKRSPSSKCGEEEDDVILYHDSNTEIEGFYPKATSLIIDEKSMFNQSIPLECIPNLEFFKCYSPVFNKPLTFGHKIKYITLNSLDRMSIFNRSITLPKICNLVQIYLDNTRCDKELIFNTCENLEVISVYHSKITLLHNLPSLVSVIVGDDYPHDIVYSLYKYGRSLVHLIVGDNYNRKLNLYDFKKLSTLQIRKYKHEIYVEKNVNVDSGYNSKNNENGVIKIPRKLKVIQNQNTRKIINSIVRKLNNPRMSVALRAAYQHLPGNNVFKEPWFNDNTNAKAKANAKANAKAFPTLSPMSWFAPFTTRKKSPEKSPKKSSKKSRYPYPWEP